MCPLTRRWHSFPLLAPCQGSRIGHNLPHFYSVTQKVEVGRIPAAVTALQLTLTTHPGTWPAGSPDASAAACRVLLPRPLLLQCGQSPLGMPGLLFRLAWHPYHAPHRALP